MGKRGAWTAALLLLSVGPPCAAQLPRNLVVRADLAALDPTYAKGLHLAWGAAAGWRVTPHASLFVDLIRQDLSDQLGDSTVWQSFLGGAWEYAFGTPELYHRQVLVTVRGGVLLRARPLVDAPYLGVGAGFRYPVASWMQFHARVEDDLDVPKAQTVLWCVAPGYCSPQHVGGHVQHNLGLFLGVELH